MAGEEVVGRAKIIVDVDGDNIAIAVRRQMTEATKAVNTGLKPALKELGGSFRQLGQDIAKNTPVIQNMRKRFDDAKGSIKGFFSSIRADGNKAWAELREGSGKLKISLADVESVLPGLARGMRGVGNAVSTVKTHLSEAREEWKKQLPPMEALRPAIDRVKNAFAGLRGAGDDAKKLATDVEGANNRIGDSSDRATKRTNGLVGAWRRMDGTVRLVIASLLVGGDQIAVLGAAAGAGLAILGSAAVTAGIGLGVAIAAFKGLGGEIAALPAEVRPAATAFQSIGKAFSDLQKQIQIRALSDLAPYFTALRDLVVKLSPALAAVGDSVNAVIRQFTTMITSANGVSVLSQLIAKAGIMFQYLASIIFNIGGGLGNIFVDAIPYARTFLDWLDQITTNWNAWTQSAAGHNAITDWLKSASQVFHAIGPLIAATGTALNQLVNPQTVSMLAGTLTSLANFMPVLGGILGAIGSLNVFGLIAQALDVLGATLTPLLIPIQQLAGVISGVLSTTLTALAPIIGQLVQAFVPLVILMTEWLQQVLPPLLAILMPIIAAVVRFASILLAALVPAMASLMPAIISVVQAFAPLGPFIALLAEQLGAMLVPVIQALAPIISSLISALLPLVAAILPLLIQLIDALMPVLTIIIGVFLQLAAAILPIVMAILPPLIALIQMLMPVVMQLVDAFIQLLTPILALIAPLLDLIVQILPPLMSIIILVAGVLINVLGGAFKAIIPIISGVISLITSILVPTINLITAVLKGVLDFIIGVFTGDWKRAWSGIVEIFSGIWNGLKGIAAGVINGIIDLINGIIKGINSLGSAVGINIGTLGHVHWAGGGIARNAMTPLIGEAGPEAVVPLNRPLSLVDPSVRGLSAIAQGKADPAAGPQKNVTVMPGAIVIQSNYNPYNTANAVLDRLVQKI